MSFFFLNNISEFRNNYHRIEYFWYNIFCKILLHVIQQSLCIHKYYSWKYTDMDAHTYIHNHRRIYEAWFINEINCRVSCLYMDSIVYKILFKHAKCQFAIWWHWVIASVCYGLPLNYISSSDQLKNLFYSKKARLLKVTDLLKME